MTVTSGPTLVPDGDFEKVVFLKIVTDPSATAAGEGPSEIAVFFGGHLARTVDWETVGADPEGLA